MNGQGECWPNRTVPALSASTPIGTGARDVRSCSRLKFLFLAAWATDADSAP